MAKYIADATVTKIEEKDKTFELSITLASDVLDALVIPFFDVWDRTAYVFNSPLHFAYILLIRRGTLSLSEVLVGLDALIFGSVETKVKSKSLVLNSSPSKLYQLRTVS